MTRRDPLELRLEHLFKVEMPPGVQARAETRVRQGLKVQPIRLGGRFRLRRSFALAFVATVMLAAAAIGAVGIYERVANAAPAGDQVAWERSIEIGASVESGVGSLTIARGYADANRVVLALGSSAREVVGGSDLIDSEGRVYTAIGGSGYVETSGESVVLESWLTPEPLLPGDVELTLSPDPGSTETWALSFTLPVDVGGVTLRPEQVATVDGVAITLHEITFSPTAVVMNVELAGLDVERAWTPVSRSGLAHKGDASIGNDGMSVRPFDDPFRQLHVVHSGTDLPAGEWTYRIDEVVGIDGNGDQIRISGAWEFTFSVP